MEAARVGLRHLFREGYEYKRAGVVLLDLAPVGAVTGDLFAAASVATSERRERLLTVLDGINARWGRATVRFLAEGLVQPWQMKRQRMSPRYTTCWAELPEAV